MWLPFLRALATCFVLIFLYTLLQGDLCMDRYISVSEARQRFLQLVDETLEGDQIIVTKRGTPADRSSSTSRNDTVLPLH